ncbi:MAG: JAB domain-containing protein [bacterium]|nr:JAB domain-containing protein [bacterium]
MTKKAIITPEEAVKLALSVLLDKHKEHFIGIYLDARLKAKKALLISLGTLTASIVHPREVFRPALCSASASIILLHNHPSGDTEPSEADLTITSRLEQAGEILGIGLIDHIIFTATGKFLSMKNEKIIK